MAILHMTSLLLKNSGFLLVFHSKLEEDFLYMAYADIMAKVSKYILILMFILIKENHFHLTKDKESIHFWVQIKYC